MEIYNEFASIYDELMNDFDYKSWFNYIKEIWKKYDKNPKKILEMACGTGNLSYYMGKEGYKLTCFDLSDNMLSKAYEKLFRFKNVNLLNSNMIDFKFNEKFHSVVSICDSINYIVEEDDLLKTFKNVWNHLSDDGVFIFDINSYYKLKYIIGNNTFIEDQDDIFYVWQNNYNDDSDVCEFYLTFFSRNDSENYIRFDEMHKEKAYKIDKILELLKMAGFSNVEHFEAFTFEAPTDKSDRINFVAFK